MGLTAILRRLLRRLRHRFDQLARRPDFEAERPLPIVATLDESVIDDFAPYTGPGEQGFMIDFLGGRTRVSYLTGYAHFDGRVLGIPKREEPVLHEHDEWLGALASVLDARRRGELVAIELGAGWGPWIVSCALAARTLGGIETVHLLGVEAASSHHAMMLTHFTDNGLEPESHSLLVGVVGHKRGVVQFPCLPDPAADWGAAELTREGNVLVDRLGRRFDEFEEVRCYPIADLVCRFPVVDLVHVDIQGAEETAIPPAMDALCDNTRRVVIGTHGLRLDRDISKAFSAAGWVVEANRPSILSSEGALMRDGIQVWRNARFD